MRSLPDPLERNAPLVAVLTDCLTVDDRRRLVRLLPGRHLHHITGSIRMTASSGGSNVTIAAALA